MGAVGHDWQERQARDAQSDYHLHNDVDRRTYWLGGLADGEARCRAVRRQRLRDDLGLANSGLRQQSVLARSLELDRSAAGAGTMLPGFADELGAARESTAAAVGATAARLITAADRATAHLIQILVVVELTFYP